MSKAIVYDTVTIPDPSFVDDKVKMLGLWYGMNNMCIFPNKISETTGDKNSTNDDKNDWNIIHLKQKSMLFDPKVRQLVNESCGVFHELQTSINDPNKTTDVLYYSKKYRAIMLTCIQAIEKHNMDKSNEAYNQYKLFLHNLELIWHLCEVLYLVTVPGGTILNSLLDWIKVHYKKAENQATIILKDKTAFLNDQRVEEKFSFYWDTVNELVLQGNTEMVRMLLCNHSQSKTEPFIQAIKTLMSMPSYSIYGGLPIAEYTSRFKGWQSIVKSKLECGTFLSDSNLNNVMKIICGEPESTTLIRKYCSTWFEFFVAQFIYSEPTMKKHNLSLYAHRSIAYYYKEPEYNHLDILALDLLDGDLEGFVNKLKSYPDSGWSSTHLTNLLYLCNKIESKFDVTKSIENTDLNEQCLIDYGTFLMSHNSLWQAGIIYLDNCSSISKGYLEFLLSKLKITSDLRVSKILHYAKTRNLHNLVSSVCKVKGMQSLQKSRLGEAFYWALRGQDNVFAEHIGDLFLKEYAKDGQFSCPDILENLGPISITCVRFMFIGKYIQFIKLADNKEFNEAAALFIELLKSDICPKYFRLRLLLDVHRFVEDYHKSYFTIADLSFITTCLDYAVLESNDDKETENQLFSKQVLSIRNCITKLISTSLNKS